MATRRTVASLAAEFASLRGVSEDAAIRIALTEAIDREGEPDERLQLSKLEVEAVSAVVANRIGKAFSAGYKWGVREFWSDIEGPLFLLIIFLAVTAFVRGLRLGAFGISFAIVIGVTIWMSRKWPRQLEEQRRERDAMEQNIRSGGSELPYELEFLSDEDDPRI